MVNMETVVDESDSQPNDPILEQIFNTLAEIELRLEKLEYNMVIVQSGMPSLPYKK